MLYIFLVVFRDEACYDKRKRERKIDSSMRKPKRRIFRPESQPYDTSLKGWVKDNPASIIPVLLPGAIFQETLDIEAIKPTMRADRVFKILYLGKTYILNIEFESGVDEKIRARLLAYNAILHLEYEIPVISLIVYPFRITLAESPLVLFFGDEEILRFHFRILPLFKEDAERYLHEHIACMYPLLPAMKGANEEIIASALAELKALYREDEVSLAQQFVWMEVLLERTTTISAEEKVRIQEGIKMYDALWEEHPRVKKINAAAKATVDQAKAELAQGKAELAQGKAELAQARAEAREAKARARAEAEALIEQAKAEFKAAAERARAEANEAAAERARAEANEAAAERARAEANEAAAKTLREDVIKIVQIRFPELTRLAQRAVEQISTPDGLNLLLIQVASASSETAARYILHPSAE